MRDMCILTNIGKTDFYMKWRRKVHIALDLGEALSYLYEIVNLLSVNLHRDVEATNLLAHNLASNSQTLHSLLKGRAFYALIPKCYIKHNISFNFMFQIVCLNFPKN